MNSLPYYTPGEHLTFLGFEMQQNRFAPLAWSEVIQRERPAQIVEIGTWKGGFTCLLGLCVNYGGCGVVTYDNDPLKPWKEIVGLLGSLGIVQIELDALKEPGVSALSTYIRAPGKCILLCDGGNKVKEFQTFAPFLKSGDIIAAHDYADSRTINFWNTQEITPIDIEATVQQCGLERYEPNLMAEAGWLAYKKV